MPNTNAASTQAGFHYQDIVGLIILMENIENVVEINVEGEDDIDVLFADGTFGYYQVKEVENPNNSRMSQKLKEALVTLEVDSLKGNVKFLIYVTNSNQPLGSLKDSLEFKKNYAFYLYNDLPAQLKYKIDKQLQRDSNIDKNRLGIMKIAYEGSDARTREAELNDRINDFISKANIPNFHVHHLKSEWRQMVASNTEFPNKKITKEMFYSHTVVTEMFSTPDFDTFFDDFDVLESNIQYIQNTYVDHLGRLMQRFDLLSGIETAFQTFRQNHTELRRKDMSFQFIDSYYLVLKEKLELISDEDNDVVKFIIWISIKATSTANNIKKAIKL